MARLFTGIAALALVAGLSATAPVEAVTPPTWNSHVGEGMNDSTDVVVLQPDGKALVGGASARFDGAPDNLMRLNADGTPDTGFNANLQGGPSREVYAIALQPNGKILIGGPFTNTGLPSYLRRLNADGTPDTAFNRALGTGLDSYPLAIAVMNDGDILVGGDFTHLNGVDVSDNLVRLNSNGTIDTETGFNAALGTGLSGGAVMAITTDGDQFVAVGGDFGSLNNQTGFPDGLLVMNGSSISQDFVNALGSGFDGTVYAVAHGADNSVYVAGTFSALDQDATVPDSFVKLTPTGVLDATYNAVLGSGFDDDVFAIAIRPDGGAFVGGDFDALNGNPVPHALMALTDTGSPDPHFNGFLNGGMNPNGYVYSIAAVSDREAVVSGNFTNVGAYPQIPEHILRLQGPGIPGAPQLVRATPGNRSVVVTWTMPKDRGGLAITDVRVSINPSGTCSRPQISRGRGSSRCTGLVNGADYTAIVSVANAVGVNQATANVRPRTLPSPVRDLRWTSPQPGVVSLTWTAPRTDGGLALTSYEICFRSCERSRNWFPVSPSRTTSTTTALENGKKYTFLVRARTDAGTSSVERVVATVSGRTSSQ